jgi:hypothetical protein
MRNLAVKNFHDKTAIKERELNESIARSLWHLERFQEALNFIKKQV